MSTLSKFYFDVGMAACKNNWRVGQALFNLLNDRRPDLAAKIRGRSSDPFYSDNVSDPSFDACCDFIEQNWTSTQEKT